LNFTPGDNGVVGAILFAFTLAFPFAFVVVRSSVTVRDMDGPETGGIVVGRAGRVRNAMFILVPEKVRPWRWRPGGRSGAGCICAGSRYLAVQVGRVPVRRCVRCAIVVYKEWEIVVRAADHQRTPAVVLTWIMRR